MMAAGVAAAAGAGTSAGAAATADVDGGFVLMTGGSGAEEEGEELEGEATERAGEPDAGACMDRSAAGRSPVRTAEKILFGAAAAVAEEPKRFPPIGVAGIGVAAAKEGSAGAAKDCGGGPKAEGAKAEPKPEAGPLKLTAVAAIRR